MRTRAVALLALRISLALLMLVWGLDKFANPAHGAAVAERFYGGLPTGEGVMPILGTLQIVLAAGVGLGVFRRFLYPVLAAVTGVTLLGVWRSVVDPWGWYLDGTNVLFFPSLVIFTGTLVLLAFVEDDRLSVDGRGVEPSPSGAPAAGSAPRTG